jgi:hypothetical protein
MAKVAEKSRTFPQRLAGVLRARLGVAGIKARVSTEPIEGTRLHRVHIAAPEFAKLRPSERQDLVWRSVGSEFTLDDQLKISMILTLSPQELKGS